MHLLRMGAVCRSTVRVPQARPVCEVCFMKAIFAVVYAGTVCATRAYVPHVRALLYTQEH